MINAIRRARVSMGHRPWWLDVCSGLTATYWGSLLIYRPPMLSDQPSFDFMDSLDPTCVGVVVLLAGLSQFSSAMLNVLWWRWVNAVFMSLFWSLLAFGIVQTHAALGIATYSGWALANMIIVVAIYEK